MKKKKKMKRRKPSAEDEAKLLEVGRMRSYGRRLGEGFRILQMNEKG
jgi:hypothetical protein